MMPLVVPVKANPEVCDKDALLPAGVLPVWIPSAGQRRAVLAHCIARIPVKLVSVGISQGLGSMEYCIPIVVAVLAVTVAGVGLWLIGNLR